ncbi:DNA polymerase III subunit beta [Blattabacterium cuenoti]|uniref:DNA polymerase III subunit beta n=1 Tax=Blattabacterium cuenoti TaxID=1653831 RepID=UPI00163BD8B2|nr:DNA polymerase III subunit beta [Blattabacterium cuenoti]
MHFSISRFSLLQELQDLQKITIIYQNEKNYEYFFLNILEKKLIITFSTDEVIITTEIQVVFSKKYSKEQVIVSSKLIIDLLTTFLDEILFIKLKKEKKILRIYSEQGDYDLPIFFKKKNFTHFYKKILYSKKITVFSNILLNSIENTLYVIENTEELRPILNGVFFEFSSIGFTFVSTNTYYLVKYSIKLDLDQFFDFTISKIDLKTLKKILTNEKNRVTTIEYKKSNNKINIKFSFKKKTFSCSFINEKYPDYNSVFPKKKYDISFIINRILFLNSIKRISILDDKNKTSIIRFYFNDNNKIKIYGKNSSSTLKIQYEFIHNDFKKKEINMGFNSQFLIEILSFLKEDFVRFELYTLSKVGILKPIQKNNKKKKESILILIMSVII